MEVQMNYLSNSRNESATWEALLGGAITRVFTRYTIKT